ncbi:MAG: M20/M25/M40 family metallo-hydrolase [Nocardioides sp.]|uniref:M20/M25/M40 family metallo-hydrolase n=1 Tax=Nocardioides sp. TaxID=35761 RepID=UPI0039E48406
MPTPAAPDLDLLLTDIRELVECESPSQDLAAVAASADVVARVGARRLGVEPERIVIDGVSHLRWRFGTPRVLVLGHHDTVWPLGTLATTPYSIGDGILRGPGCFDMLAGVAMAFHAIATLPDRDGVGLLITGDEEVGSISSRALIEDEARPVGAVLVLEAAAEGGALKTARKGTSMYEMAVTGRAAHAGLEPEKGVNASVELAHQILALAALGDASAGTSVVPTVLAGGTTLNTVPARAQVAVDVRAWTAAEQERVDAAIRALAPALPGAELTVTGGVNRAPLEERASLGLFEAAQAVAARLGLAPLARAAVGGASDGNFTAGAGTPTLDGLGAVGGGAHAADEHVLVGALVDRTALVAGLLGELLTDRLPERQAAGRRRP